MYTVRLGGTTLDVGVSSELRHFRPCLNWLKFYRVINKGKLPLCVDHVIHRFFFCALVVGHRSFIPINCSWFVDAALWTIQYNC